MGIGPIEVVVIGFQDNKFNGRILPEIRSLIDRGIINIVDALFVTKDVDGAVAYVEIEQSGLDEGLTQFSELMGATVADLINHEDVETLTVGLAPNSSAVMIVFEHTWAKPFKEAVEASGGVMVADVRIPGAVADEIVAALENA